ncbi:hypothetical protein VTK56DRAFT_2584 [Thermocarpiscus australiensis]
MSYDCDVLIVGAGPVGAALALELALHHVSIRIIDKAPVRNDKSRALVVQPRTLELLNRHGAGDRLVRRGRTLRGASLYFNTKLAVKIDLDDLGTTDTEFPLPLTISQAETEAFLDECLSKYNVRVERPVSATSITQDSSGVTTALETPGGMTRTLRSKFVVGCDGAHSIVRHASDITFEGAAYPQEFILCDAHLRDSNLPQDRLVLHFGGQGLLAQFPINSELVRLVASRRRVIGEARDQPTLAEFQTYFSSMTAPGSGTLHDPIWLTRYRLHRRGVNRYRDGRLFLAGDAAHIHSPAGGQGMNTGIQDSINLGWKLALALALQLQAQAEEAQGQGKEDVLAKAEALLDTYDAERQPVGRALLRGTDRLFAFMTSGNRFFIPLRNFFLRYVMPWLVRSTRRRRAVFQFLSEFGITYRHTSPIVGTATWFRGPVRGGDRLPDGRLRDAASGRETTLHRVCVGAPHHLLLFAGVRDSLGMGPLEAAGDRVVRVFKSGVRVHYIAAHDRLGSGEEWLVDPEGKMHAQFGFSRPGYVLVRPDGYAAHIGPLAKLDQLISFLDR